MAQVAKIWENLYYGMIGRNPMPQNYSAIKSWTIGNKIVQGQLYNEKVLKNGNTQKRITTLFSDGNLGLETGIYSPSGELLKSYVGIRTTSRTVPNIKSASDICKKYKLEDAIILPLPYICNSL